MSTADNLLTCSRTGITLKSYLYPSCNSTALKRRRVRVVIDITLLWCHYYNRGSIKRIGEVYTLKYEEQWMTQVTEKCYLNSNE